jgi:hypothetical protein
MRFKYRKIRIHVVKSVLTQPVPYTLQFLHSLFHTCSHGTFLDHMEPIFWFAPSSHTVYIPQACSWEHMQGFLEPETTLTIACNTRATRRSVSVDGFNSFESLERLWSIPKERYLQSQCKPSINLV